MSQNLNKKAKTLSIHSSGGSPKASNPYNLKKTISTFCSSTRSQSDSKDAVNRKRSPKGLTSTLSLHKLGLFERNEDSLKVNLFPTREDDLNSKIRDLLTEPKAVVINKNTRKDPVITSNKKEKSTQGKASHIPVRLEKKGIQMNPLSLSNLNEMILKEFETGKQSHSKREYEGLGSFPLSARGHEENASKMIRNRRSNTRKSESGQKLANLCKGTASVIEKLEKMEAKPAVRSKVKQNIKGLNSEADYKGSSSKVKRYTLTNTSKTEKSICGTTTTKESLPRQGGEYFTKLSSAQAQKSISPKESLNKIEEKKKMKAKPPKNVFGLKNLNLKALSTNIIIESKKSSLTGSISSRQAPVKVQKTRQCDTDRPKTSAETAGSICNYTTARRSNDKNGFTSERKMPNEDSEIQSLIDLLEEASREETTVFEASGCQSRKTVQSEQNFDGDDYINTIISKVQKDFRDNTGRAPNWCIGGSGNTESKNQALILINNFCSN